MRDRGVHTALALLVGAVALMWALEFADQHWSLGLDRLGIEPREPRGLLGIVFAPFLHGTWSHLASNTVPLVVFGTVIALSGLRRLVGVTVICATVAGVGTWLTGDAGSLHIGASAVIFGYATYLMARGLYTRHLLHVAIGVGVFLLYGGTMALGTVPTPGVSWQGHLFGVLGGLLATGWASREDQRGAVSVPAR